jgi:hypothetical protein
MILAIFFLLLATAVSITVRKAWTSTQVFTALSQAAE